MGAEHPAALVTDRDGLAWCAGGMTVTTRDFARVGALLLDGGRRDEAWRSGEWRQSFSIISADMSYRAGWYAVHAEPKLLLAMGVHGQNLFIDFEHRAVIAKLSSQAQRIDAGAIWLTHAALPALIRCAADRRA